MSSNPGKTISVKHIPRITKNPFLEAFSPRNITSAFEKTGIWPLNSSPFVDEDFDATLVYKEQSIKEPVSDELNLQNDYGDVNIPNQIAETEGCRNQPSTSKDAVIDPTQSQTESKMLSPEVVRPFPKVKKETKTLRRPKANQGKSRIYTESPEKRRVEEIEEAKIEKQKKKSEGQKGKLKQTSEDVNSPSTSDVVKMKKIKQVKKKYLLIAQVASRLFQILNVAKTQTIT